MKARNNMDSEAIGNIIMEYCEKHDIDLESTDIGEAVYQNENAYEDAVEYFVKILKECQP
jgi:hypothetical protein